MFDHSMGWALVWAIGGLGPYLAQAFSLDYCWLIGF